ncbi:GDSL esterase/lipase At5g37690 isoform X2 [Sorghum bicolor]|uniref:GDSL esterase/lipase n=1 Tax=Sorghum bicolor TaxID=4558 RepID=C5XPL3_SORBI|nr:GDSL esterase/lipase At5g37690 isoform X2 [Sorghum bicolor]EES01001.2 hypothetical protein SORBI_3003G205900 [Sorghum bicolor]|eukprot:XP_021311132.1 GDSL esterase/lipase At5g37690 isoform X2 [Sorghum bicolor]
MRIGVLLLPCLGICMQVALIGGTTVASGGGGVRAPAMFVFGSSILDVGNNNYLQGATVGRANSPYNGVDFPGSVPTGRFSNGYNIADYVAKNMGFACSPPPYLSMVQSSSGPLVQTALTSGINYASGGAGILDSTNAGSTIPLSKEVKYFGATKAKMVAAVGPNTANPAISQSIFLIGMGNNDLYVFAASERARNRSAADDERSDAAAAALYAGLISNYSAAVTELYTLGARKFAVINVWPLGCVPGQRVLSPTGACSDTLNEVAAGFNAALGSLLVDLAARLPGLVYSLGDAFGFTEDVLADPAASGYTDVAGTCCGGGRLGAEAWCSRNSTLCVNRDQHVFWDRVHPSQRTAFLIARALYDGPSKR